MAADILANLGSLEPRCAGSPRLKTCAPAATCRRICASGSNARGERCAGRCSRAGGRRACGRSEAQSLPLTSAPTLMLVSRYHRDRKEARAWPPENVRLVQQAISCLSSHLGEMLAEDWTPILRGLSAVPGSRSTLRAIAQSSSHEQIGDRLAERSFDAISRGRGRE